MTKWSTNKTQHQIVDENKEVMEKSHYTILNIILYNLTVKIISVL